ncbi:17708_t:CDS:2, partial [Cetraspora pellucida]
RNPYASIRKTLRLFVDEVEEHNPQDIAYVYSGYVPLSVLRMLPGKTFDEVQRQEEGAIRPKSNLIFIGLGQHPRATLVFFLGECTYTEISAIRFLAQDY